MKKLTIIILVTGAVIGILDLLLVALGNPANMGFCIACFERDIAGAFGLFSKPFPMSWIRPEIIGIVLGSFLAGLIFKEFKPSGGSSPLARFFLAFFVMLGALCFLGCPTRMILRLGGGDLNALVAVFGFAAGIYAGVVMIKKGFNLGVPKNEKTATGLLIPIIMVALLVMAIVFPLFPEGAGKHLGATGRIGVGEEPAIPQLAGIFVSLGAGLVVGFLAQRSRFCFMGGFRDLFMVKGGRIILGLAAVLVVTAAGNLIFGKFKLGFEQQPFAHTNHLFNFLGMALVGIGSCLLGGCPFRQLVLAGQGSSDSAVTITGMMAGAAVSHNFALLAAKTDYGQGVVILGLVLVLSLGLTVRDKL